MLPVLRRIWLEDVSQAVQAYVNPTSFLDEYLDDALRKGDPDEVAQEERPPLETIRRDTLNSLLITIGGDGSSRTSSKRKFRSVLEALMPQFESSETQIRRHAFKLLGLLLVRCPDLKVTEEEIKRIVQICLLKMNDWHSVDGAISAIAAILDHHTDAFRWSNVILPKSYFKNLEILEGEPDVAKQDICDEKALVREVSSARGTLETIFSWVHIGSFAQGVRLIILQVLQRLLSDFFEDAAAVGPLLITGICAAVENERDPRNLLVSMPLMRQLLMDYSSLITDKANHRDLISDVLFGYFPVRFTPPPNNPFGVTQEQLRSMHIRCFTANPQMLGHAFDVVLDVLNEGLAMEQIEDIGDACSMLTFLVRYVVQNVVGPAVYTKFFVPAECEPGLPVTYEVGREVLLSHAQPLLEVIKLASWNMPCKHLKRLCQLLSVYMRHMLVLELHKTPSTVKLEPPEEIGVSCASPCPSVNKKAIDFEHEEASERCYPSTVLGLVQTMLRQCATHMSRPEHVARSPGLYSSRQVFLTLSAISPETFKLGVIVWTEIVELPFRVVDFLLASLIPPCFLTVPRIVTVDIEQPSPEKDRLISELGFLTVLFGVTDEDCGTPEPETSANFFAGSQKSDWLVEEQMKNKLDISSAASQSNNLPEKFSFQSSDYEIALQVNFGAVFKTLADYGTGLLMHGRGSSDVSQQPAGDTHIDSSVNVNGVVGDAYLAPLESVKCLTFLFRLCVRLALLKNDEERLDAIRTFLVYVCGFGVFGCVPEALQTLGFQESDANKFAGEMQQAATIWRRTFTGEDKETSEPDAVIVEGCFIVLRDLIEREECSAIQLGYRLIDHLNVFATSDFKPKNIVMEARLLKSIVRGVRLQRDLESKPGTFSTEPSLRDSEEDLSSAANAAVVCSLLESCFRVLALVLTELQLERNVESAALTSLGMTLLKGLVEAISIVPEDCLDVLRTTEKSFTEDILSCFLAEAIPENPLESPSLNIFQLPSAITDTLVILCHLLVDKVLSADGVVTILRRATEYTTNPAESRAVKDGWVRLLPEFLKSDFAVQRDDRQLSRILEDSKACCMVLLVPNLQTTQYEDNVMRIIVPTEYTAAAKQVLTVVARSMSQMSATSLLLNELREHMAEMVPIKESADVFQTSGSETISGNILRLAETYGAVLYGFALSQEETERNKLFGSFWQAVVDAQAPMLVLQAIAVKEMLCPRSTVSPDCRRTDRMNAALALFNSSVPFQPSIIASDDPFRISLLFAVLAELSNPLVFEGLLDALMKVVQHLPLEAPDGFPMHCDIADELTLAVCTTILRVFSAPIITSNSDSGVAASFDAHNLLPRKTVQLQQCHFAVIEALDAYQAELLDSCMKIANTVRLPLCRLYALQIVMKSLRLSAGHHSSSVLAVSQVSPLASSHISADLLTARRRSIAPAIVKCKMDIHPVIRRAAALCSSALAFVQ